MPDSLVSISRPNGAIYRPRKVVAYDWEDPWAWDTATQGAVVFGTHDVDRARPVAEQVCGNYAVNPRKGWWRDGYANGERAWIHDPVRGRAGVMFDASDDPDPEPGGM